LFFKNLKNKQQPLAQMQAVLLINTKMLSPQLKNLFI